ncbi:MAG: BNR-4 repeat-containing protein, partial [Promethearchaeota archaeon]
DVVETPLLDIHNDALVLDYEKQGLLVYLKDITFDSRGNPIILYLTSKGYEPGPKNDPRTWKIAWWKGKEWRFHDIICSDNNYDTGCMLLLDDDNLLVIGPMIQGPQPGNPGGEMAIIYSRNAAKSWFPPKLLTSGSIYNHTYARKPVNASFEFASFWADGNPREPSSSRLYFYNYSSDKVFCLPPKMHSEFEIPKVFSPHS